MINAKLFSYFCVMVTLDDLKQELLIDFSDFDVSLQRKLDVAIAIIERYTNIIVRERTGAFVSDGCPIKFYEYPIQIISIDKPYKEYKGVDYICIDTEKGANISVKFGDTTTAIPEINEAIIRLAVYLYENKESSSVTLPVDIQLLVNQFRRGLF